MIYQFEHEEIKRCRECPCHSWADFPDEKDWCDLQDNQVAYDSTPEHNSCPLVAIAKTTSQEAVVAKNATSETKTRVAIDGVVIPTSSKTETVEPLGDDLSVND